MVPQRRRGCIALASSPCRPLRQERDVAHRYQWHEKGRDQRKRQTLHQRSVIEGTEKYRIEEICDAEQVPGEESRAETILIVGGNACGNPRRGDSHGDVAKSRWPGKSAWQKSLCVAHQKSQANKSPAIQSDEKHRRDRDDHLPPGRNPHACQEEQERRSKCDTYGNRAAIGRAHERPVRSKPKHDGKPEERAEKQEPVSGVHGVLLTERDLARVVRTDVSSNVGGVTAILSWSIRPRPRSGVKFGGQTRCG
jgi:hypothetical protein